MIKSDTLQHFFNTASITELLKGNWGRDDVIIIHQWLSELNPKMRRNMRLNTGIIQGSVTDSVLLESGISTIGLRGSESTWTKFKYAIDVYKK